MINNSLPDYLFIRASIFGLRAIGPLSVAYSLARPFFPLGVQWRLYLLPLDVYAALEAIFLSFTYLPLRARCQQPVTHPTVSPESSRKDLFKKCIHTTKEHDKYLKQWFRDADTAEVKRENVKEFFAWAFLNKASPKEETEFGELNTLDRRYEPELQGYITELERKTGTVLPKGYGNAKSLRLTLDEVRMAHRPLIWYTIVLLVDVSTHFWLLFHKFGFYRLPLSISSLQIFPPRPQTAMAQHVSRSPRLSYWYRPHTARKHRPIVFLHGIGIGISTYVPFLAELSRPSKGDDQDGDIGILAIELLPISFRITSSLPRREQFCTELMKILESHEEYADGFTLVAHSYGSVLATHILSSNSVPNLRSLVKGLVLIDPVSILLHLPDVAYNFTYRSPRTASQWQLWYFASTDMGVAHTLARGFFWSENISWKNDCKHLPLTVFLAGQDIIAPTSEVCGYLTKFDVGDTPEWSGGEWDKEHIIWRTSENIDALKTVVWCEDLNHAQIFDRKGWRRMLVTETRRAALAIR